MTSGNRRSVMLWACAALLALSAPAFAADLGVKRPVYKAPPPVVVYGWSGFYAGANIGYSWGRARHDWNVFALAVSGFTACASDPAAGALCSDGSGSNKLNGAIGGLQAGYNWQNGNFLAGIETDIQLSGQKGGGVLTSAFSTSAAEAPGVLALDQSAKLEWLGTLRGRAAFTFDRWLVYGAGGLAYSGVKVESAASATGGSVRSASGCPFLPFATWSNRRTKAGWVVGAGIEGAVGDRWTVKLEYLHVDLGTVETAFATLPGFYGNQAGASSAGALYTAATERSARG